jgi:Adenylate and Guanylate cyclase catalytic domain/Double zinc ribbon
MNCPSCGADVAQAAKFCGRCGTALPLVCSACGHQPAARQILLRVWGKSLPGQFAQITDDTSPGCKGSDNQLGRAAADHQHVLRSMFCEVGSTALSSKLDPEEQRDVVSTFLSACATGIKRLGGTVANYLGDGVLAYFGSAAHEDDAERAVRAGLAILNVVRLKPAPDVTLQARIGIASGVVVVGDLVREGVTQENAAIGETTNLAARLQSVARAEAYALHAALVADGEPHLGVVPFICFEWHQRPENVLSGHIA